jgi:hypothetical protein
MTRSLLLGLDPEPIDFSDPALPPGICVGVDHQRLCGRGTLSARFRKLF